MGETSWSRISLTVSTLLICKRLAYRKAMSFHHRRHMGDFDEGNIAIVRNDPGLDNAAGLIYTHTSTANGADSPKNHRAMQMATKEKHRGCLVAWKKVVGACVQFHHRQPGKQILLLSSSVCDVNRHS